MLNIIDLTDAQDLILFYDWLNIKKCYGGVISHNLIIGIFIVPNHQNSNK